MNSSQPTKGDDAITRALTSRQVNEIRHLVPGQSLLVMTSGAEWRCYPGPSAPGLTPAACATLPQTSFGCSHVPPIQTANSVLFVQERGSRVRELRFDVLQDQYQSMDMSVMSSHLFYDTGGQYTIQEWAFAEELFRIVWAARSAMPQSASSALTTAAGTSSSFPCPSAISRRNPPLRLKRTSS